MRVIGGKFKSLKLFSPSGHALRPTMDRVREALFNILRDSFFEGRVLDLFAGAGTLGIEALSRGAGVVTFIERDQRSLNLLRRNLKRLREAQARSRVIPADVFQALPRLNNKGERFDLIFVDPPYYEDLWLRVLVDLDKYALLDEDGLVVLEVPKTRASPITEVGHLELIKKRSYGEVTLEFWGYKSNGVDGDEDSHLPR